MSSAAADPTRPPSQWGVAALGVFVLFGGALALGLDSPRLGALLVVGGLLGMSLYHACRS